MPNLGLLTKKLLVSKLELRIGHKILTALLPNQALIPIFSSSIVLGVAHFMQRQDAINRKIDKLKSIDYRHPRSNKIIHI